MGHTPKGRSSVRSGLLPQRCPVCLCGQHTQVTRCRVGCARWRGQDAAAKPPARQFKRTFAMWKAPLAPDTRMQLCLLEYGEKTSARTRMTGNATASGGGAGACVCVHACMRVCDCACSVWRVVSLWSRAPALDIAVPRVCCACILACPGGDCARAVPVCHVQVHQARRLLPTPQRSVPPLVAARRVPPPPPPQQTRRTLRRRD